MKRPLIALAVRCGSSSSWCGWGVVRAVDAALDTAKIEQLTGVKRRAQHSRRGV